MVYHDLTQKCDKSSCDTDEQIDLEPSVEVPIGDGTASIYGTALDAYRVRFRSMP